MRKPTIVFDTCAIDDIIDSSDKDALLGGLVAGYSVKLTMVNLGEIGAIPNSDRRTRVRKGFAPLLSHDGNECWLPPHAILRKLTDAFRVNKHTFDWKALSIRFPAGEAEFARGEVLDDFMADTQRTFQKKYDT
jgi:hypothetical protein